MRARPYLSSTIYRTLPAFFDKLSKDNLLPEGFIDIYKKMNVGSGEKGKKIDSEIKQWIISDIGEIIKICKKNKINIILQDYPIQENVSDMLYNIAQVNSVPFVSNYHEFKQLLNRGPNEKEYFAFDGQHCNAEGYAIIARNIFDKIKQEKMFSLER